jgi:hypothetical protein
MLRQSMRALSMFFTWIITLVRRSGIRTVPQALRSWANQVDDVFSLLVMKPPWFPPFQGGLGGISKV